MNLTTIATWDTLNDSERHWAGVVYAKPSVRAGAHDGPVHQLRLRRQRDVVDRGGGGRATPASNDAEEEIDN